MVDQDECTLPILRCMRCKHAFELFLDRLQSSTQDFSIYLHSLIAS